MAMLEFLTQTLKRSELPNKLEYELVADFIKFGTRTSHPEFRNNFNKVIKAYFERNRLVYEREIYAVGVEPKKGAKVKPEK